jgi:uncharacterized protein with von Willebrand factor type A (vWA) domain
MGEYGGAMGTVAKGNTPATEIAFDRMTELLLADETEYPNEITFIPADLASFGDVMSRALLGEKAIIVVYPDGRERFIPAPAAGTA